MGYFYNFQVTVKSNQSPIERIAQSGHPVCTAISGRKKTLKKRNG
jgi:hypothetical protein